MKNAPSTPYAMTRPKGWSSQSSAIGGKVSQRR